MRTSFRSRLAAAAATAGLIFGGLGPSAIVPTLAADEAKTLRIGTIQEFDSINPNLSYLVSSYEAMILNYDLLVGFGPNLEYAPTGFAESWSLNGSTWEFKVRPGMKWSDGQPADANDVAFTYQYLLDSMDPKYKGAWAPDGNDVDADGSADNPLSLFGDFLVSTVELQKVEVVDATTVRMTTAFPTQLFLGAYIPIFPKHIWDKVTFASAATDYQVDPPVVGTGPYQIVEWKRGEFARFERNPNYWGKKPYVEEVIFQFYGNEDAMTQALKAGTVDYIRGVIPEQYKTIDAEAKIVGVDGVGAGWTQLAFNTYDKDIPDGGASTTALRDSAFRSALDRAVDRTKLVDQVLQGYGKPGTTIVPPTLPQFRKDPANPRAFSLEDAAAALDAAGYKDSNGNGTREDKEGKEINLRIYFPDTDSSYPKAGQFIADWWKEIGIGVTLQSFDSDTLTSLLYTPEAGGKADYDIELWGWTGSADPDFLLSIFTTNQIGVWSDSNYSNPAYDALYDQQKKAPTFDERKAIVDKMQDKIYDDAPYIILFYDDELHAYRNDKFEGWALQPRDGGVSIFATGVETYLNLVPVGSSATPSPAPGAPSGSPGASPAPTPVDGTNSSNSSSSTPLLLGIGGLVVIIALGLLFMRRRGTVATVEDDD
ncbi:MAG: ABC transporter substrate-binding protein [Candidatus Limnocylindrales bacterium]